MQKLGLSHNLQQKLSPQQIQFIKLLQVPTAELDSRIEEELEINPALEEGEEEDSPEPAESPESTESSEEEPVKEEAVVDQEVDLKDYLGDDEYSGYKTQSEGSDEEDREMPIPMGTSLQETLMTQLGFLGLNDHQYAIGKQLVGSIESDGYIRRTWIQLSMTWPSLKASRQLCRRWKRSLRKYKVLTPPASLRGTCRNAFCFNSTEWITARM